MSTGGGAWVRGYHPLQIHVPHYACIVCDREIWVFVESTKNFSQTFNTMKENVYAIWVDLDNYDWGQCRSLFTDIAQLLCWVLRASSQEINCHQINSQEISSHEIKNLRRLSLTKSICHEIFRLLWTLNKLNYKTNIPQTSKKVVCFRDASFTGWVQRKSYICWWGCWCQMWQIDLKRVDLVAPSPPTKLTLMRSTPIKSASHEMWCGNNTVLQLGATHSWLLNVCICF